MRVIGGQNLTGFMGQLPRSINSYDVDGSSRHDKVMTPCPKREAGVRHTVTTRPSLPHPLNTMLRAFPGRFMARRTSLLRRTESGVHSSTTLFPGEGGGTPGTGDACVEEGKFHVGDGMLAYVYAPLRCASVRVNVLWAQSVTMITRCLRH